MAQAGAEGVRDDAHVDGAALEQDHSLWYRRLQRQRRARRTDDADLRPQSPCQDVSGQRRNVAVRLASLLVAAAWAASSY